MNSLYSTDSDINSSYLSSSTTSNRSKMTTTEVALLSVFGSLLFLILLWISIFCIRKKRSRDRSTNSLQLSLSPSISNQSNQSQPSRLPLHQPSESPSFSSFTRITPNSPEMISVSSSRTPTIRTTSAAAVVSFSFARLFSKQQSSSSSTSTSTSSKRVPDTYPYNQNYSMQKTLSMDSSTPSSIRDYYYDVSRSGKQSTKDGFPVITLTSPTNSEYSIPIPPQDQIAGPVDYNQVPTFSFSSSSTSLASVSSSSPSRSPSPSPSSIQSPKYPSFNLPTDEGSTSAMTSKVLQEHPYVLNQTVPQHMLLHPSYTYTRPTKVEEPSSSSASGSGSLTDFPPTYEEAVDHPSTSNASSSSGSSGGSSGSDSSSNRKNTQESLVSSPILQEPTSSTSSNHFPDSSSLLSIHQSDVPLYQESGWTRDVGTEEQTEDLQGDAGISINIEDDPLETLSRRSSVYNLT